MNYNVKIIDYWSFQHKDLYQGIVALTKSINDTYCKLSDKEKKYFSQDKINNTDIKNVEYIITSNDYKEALKQLPFLYI